MILTEMRVRRIADQRLLKGIRNGCMERVVRMRFESRYFKGGDSCEGDSLANRWWSANGVVTCDPKTKSLCRI